ncbi:hypothetical protein DRQ33_01275 [bacterium]|nr:MAG: hypothetical protein DRQ33_01275 [bacterium]
MKSLGTIIIFFVFFCGTIMGYTINGRISSPTGEAIPAAHIYLPAEKTGTTADIEGYYTLEIGPGVHKFKVTAVGFRDIDTSLTISGDRELNFVMQSEAMIGDIVVVAASRVEQSILDTPVSTTVASGDILAERATTDIKDAIEHIPGVSINKYQISIRNSSGYSQGCGSRVTMLIDGVPVIAGDTGEIKWDALPTNAVSQVEVVKGAGSALYGSGSIGGTVNIVTKKPSKIISGANPNGELKIFSKLGVYDEPVWEEWNWTNKTLTLKNVGFLWGSKTTNSYYLATADITQSDGYRQGDDFIRGKSFLKYNHKFSDYKSITTFLNLGYEDRASYFQWESPKKALNTEPGRENDRVWSSKVFGALIYEDDIPSRHLFFTGKLYDIFSNWNSKIYNTDTEQYELEASRGNKIGADAQLIFTWDKQLISGGGEFAFMNNTSVTFGDHIGWGGAIFIQDEISYIHPVVFNIGGRFDLFWVDSANTDFFIGISPKSSIIYHLTENLTLRANLSSGFRIPTMAELFTRTNAGGIIRVEPNPDLEPERGYTTELGMSYAKNQYIFTGALFYNLYQNMIEPRPIYGFVFQFKNYHKVRIYGGEITGNLELGRLNLSGGYMFTSSVDLETDEKLPYRPDHSVTASMGYSIWDNLTLGTDFRYKSKPKYALFTNSPAVDKKVVDFYAKWVLGAFNISARVNNAFNYNYTEIENNIAPIRHFVLSLDYRVF